MIMKALFPALLLSLALAISSPAADQKVYICTGPKSVCYHKTKTCSGLKKCSGQVKQVSLQEAEKMGRRSRNSSIILML